MEETHQLDLVHKAITAGIFGHIQWKDAAAQLVRNDPEMETFTPEGIRARLRKFVMDGNQLTARRETRVEYLQDHPNDPFWYRAIIPVVDFARGLFVEVKLIDADSEEPWVEIVSAHRQC